VSMMDLFYWFAGKRSLRNQIIPFLTPLIEDVREFREPFCGAAAITLSFMSLYPNRIFWLNDRDPAVACLWFAVKNYPDQLIELVQSFHPHEDAFRKLKARLAATIRLPAAQNEIVELGFCILAVQFMSWSGWGGGFRGSYEQRYDRLGERWLPELTIRKIRFLHRRLNRVETRITGFDFGGLIQDTKERALIYCDPPFINAGNRYRHRFSPADHARLAAMLEQTPHHWVVSYSHHAKINRLYRWARIESITDRDVLIMPKRVSY
jgi:site-specific DNA-adenine methylase